MERRKTAKSSIYFDIQSIGDFCPQLSSLDIAVHIEPHLVSFHPHDFLPFPRGFFLHLANSGTGKNIHKKLLRNLSNLQFNFAGKTDISEEGEQQAISLLGGDINFRTAQVVLNQYFAGLQGIDLTTVWVVVQRSD